MVLFTIVSVKQPHLREFLRCAPLLLLMCLASCKQPSGREQQAETTTPAPDSHVAHEAVPTDSIPAPVEYEEAEPDPSWFEASIKGQGIISISDKANQYRTRFNFYDDKGRPVAYIQVNDSATQTVIGNRTYRDIDSSHPWRPRFFDPEPDYFKIYFDAVGTTDGYYKVLLNRETGQTGYIKRDDRNFRFQTVEQFVENQAEAGIEFHIKRNPLRKQPAEKAAIIKAGTANKFNWVGAKKLAIRGDWMQVRLDSGETGWIRWRQGNNLLIGLIYRC